ncbi:DUF1385 domain-containing protein [Dehalococcoidia bacterium]|nr:DUF1385 domain-containing protein [Dehalococcoidia bacterium]MCL0069247.1 DUF1385 domain-containing protein [Dehalococcoidia bacterium]MCL0079764.1 DUF1385 domain-containing protein [Dehalococcoidia bacterium]MCL0097480.1 DUF1385 domain-containing protein [Dehalococcoidia bacterium]
MPKRIRYGGQAVLEGVMMRGPNRMKVAVRRPDGEIVSMADPVSTVYAGRLRKTPLLRGIFALIEALILGVKALTFSAKIAAESELEEELKPGILWATVGLGLVLGVALFVILPMLITHYGIDRLTTSPVISNAADGIIRLLFFITYLALISRIPDIRRVFAYHGAEHKAVNAFEAGATMTVENVQRYSTSHTRCGTGFLLIVMVIAIMVFVFTGQPALWLRLLSRLALLPVIAAIGYELIHLAANHTGNRIVRAVMAPGLALQSLTTRQPDSEQVEVAIAALEGVIETEE